MSGAIGAILREERLARGINHEDVEQATKIRARYIEAIEDERWEVLPGRAYARAFLRTYAELLEIDPDPLLAELERDLVTAEADEELPLEPVVQRGTLPGGPKGRFWRPPRLHSRRTARLGFADDAARVSVSRAARD